MPFKNAALLLFLSCLSFFSFSQNVSLSVTFADPANNNNPDTILYAKNKKVRWSDFQGKPDMSSNAGAVTASGYAYKASMAIDQYELNININIYTYFVRSLSWKKDFINDDYHLMHEQHHFDITMLGARKFADKLLKAKFTSANYKYLIGKIFDDCYEENVALQEQYDRETNHSILRTEQYAWNDKIQKEIGEAKLP